MADWWNKMLTFFESQSISKNGMIQITIPKLNIKKQKKIATGEIRSPYLLVKGHITNRFDYLGSMITEHILIIILSK